MLIPPPARCGSIGQHWQQVKLVRGGRGAIIRRTKAAPAFIVVTGNLGEGFCSSTYKLWPPLLAEAAKKKNAPPDVSRRCVNTTRRDDVGIERHYVETPNCQVEGEIHRAQW